jgi:hypothetical protein
MARKGYYDLYSYIEPKDREQFTPAKLVEFVQRVYGISQSVVPVKTGALKNSWYLDIDEDGSGVARITFGYGKRYAMPVDYYTGGRSQRGFFSGSVKMAYDLMTSNKAGNIDENASVRGVNAGGDIVKPGRT